MTEQADFIHEIRVGWGDCDPAQIVFTGQIPNFSLQAIDAWWEHHLGGDGWYQLNIDRNIGTPFVHLSIDFKVPVTPRFKLQCKVRVMRLGQSSIEFQVCGIQNNTLCFEGKFICVFVISDKHSKIPAPASIRKIIAPLLPASAT